MRGHGVGGASDYYSVTIVRKVRDSLVHTQCAKRETSILSLFIESGLHCVRMRCALYIMFARLSWYSTIALWKLERSTQTCGPGLAIVILRFGPLCLYVRYAFGKCLLEKQTEWWGNTFRRSKPKGGEMPFGEVEVKVHPSGRVESKKVD